MSNSCRKGMILMSLLPFLSLLPTPAVAAPVATGKPAIVLVAFGTSVPRARQVFAHIDEQARLRYPGYQIRWAFTSQFIIAKLKDQGIVTRSVAEVVAELRASGVTSVVFQSLHVVPGEEYRSVQQVDTSGLQVAYGAALLSSDSDIAAVIEALRPQIDPAQPTVLVAHGNNRHPQFNERILDLAERIEGQFPNLVVASVEGQPGTGPLAKARALSGAFGSVRFLPLMVVAGDHIMNDVMGDDADSWKNQVGAAHSECSASLGWNDAILSIYFAHLDRAMASLGGAGS